MFWIPVFHIGIGIPCIQYTIPAAVGESNIVLGTGIMEFSFGLASIAVMPLAGKFYVQGRCYH